MTFSFASRNQSSSTRASSSGQSFLTGAQAKTPGIAFQKMHSLGNDFVILMQEAAAEKALPGHLIRTMADRRLGIGCDQLLCVRPSTQPSVHAEVLIFNPDASEVEACGNGTRCVMWLLTQKYGISSVSVETKAGILEGCVTSTHDVEVTQGKPKLLSSDPLDLEEFGLEEGYAVSMGNPHLVVPVPPAFNPERLQALGPRLEAHSFFPDKTNVEFVIPHEESVHLWVWERGAGQTHACASGASATVFALQNEGLLSAPLTLVQQQGGDLWVSQDSEGRMCHRADVVPVFEGIFKLST